MSIHAAGFSNVKKYIAMKLVGKVHRLAVGMGLLQDREPVGVAGL